jgi:hypothetical protein
VLAVQDSYSYLDHSHDDIISTIQFTLLEQAKGQAEWATKEGEEMKIAAIFARVSSSGQRELSLDTQVDRASSRLQAQGYHAPADRILKIDWTSLDLFNCPEFQMLRKWVLNKEVAALGILDRDRLNAQGLQRLIFLTECKDAGVELVICQGPPILDEPEGQLVELALALGKERQVMRAGQGARDGLRDRARLKGLPAVAKNPYGYSWSQDRARLLPSSEWPTASFICLAGLDGMPIRNICRELYHRGIPSLTGRPQWSKSTVHRILTNPLYGGHFHALRWVRVLPGSKRTRSYGKTSMRLRPLGETIPLSNVVVEQPPLSWDEWLALQKRLEANKAQAMRHAKRDYLLRSLIFCDTHRLRYQGGPDRSRKKWLYQCPGPKELGGSHCVRPNMMGIELEDSVKGVCRELLSNPEVIEQQITQRAGQVETTLDSLRTSLLSLDKKEARNRHTEANLVMDKATGSASPESYEQCLSLVKAERTWITEERQRLQAQVSTITDGREALLGLAQIRESLAAKLDSASNEDWRLIFAALDLQVHVSEQGVVQVALAIPTQSVSIVSTTPS